MSKFDLQLNCVVFSTNVTLNQRLILSLDKDKIVFPSLTLTPEIIDKGIDDSLIQFLKQYVFVSDLELLPQLITLNSTVLSNDTKNTLNVVYGFIVQHTQSINNAFWLEFQLLKEQPYSNLLFEVMQTLR